MGVMACNRDGCRNIMCTRHSHEFGYICDECFEELTDFLLVKGECAKFLIEEFMDSNKNDPYGVPARDDIIRDLNDEFVRDEDD